MDDHCKNLDRARQALKLAQSSLRRDLAEYPTPVAGCDEQFNHLLDQRERVRNALAALEVPNFIPTPRRLAPDRSIESR